VNGNLVIAENSLFQEIGFHNGEKSEIDWVSTGSKLRLQRRKRKEKEK